MKLTSLALASVLALGAAGASLAQPDPGGPPPAAATAGHAWMHGEHGPPDFAKMAEQHAARLRAVLQLRQDQEPALQALIAAMKPDAAEMQRWKDERSEAQTLTTPQRLDRMQARMSEHQAAFARRADAIKRFYAQLNPAQQRAFDALHQGRGMHGMGGFGDMHEGHGMGPGREGPR